MNRTVVVNTAEVAKLVGELNNAADILYSGTAAAVNRVAETVREDTVRNIVSQINLPMQNVDAAVAIVQRANAARMSAKLEIADAPHFVSTFPHRQRAAANFWTPAKYAATFGTLAAPVRLPSGKLAQWVPRTGDKIVGLPAGTKKAGLSVSIHPGKTSKWDHTFVMPVRSGKVMAGRVGSFSHPRGGGKPRAKYGPSEYQAANGVWRDGEDKIAELLGAEIFNEITLNLNNTLGKV